LAIDRLRRQRRWWRLLPFWQATAPEVAPSAEQHASDAERMQRLRKALACLKPREAECFALRHLHGLDMPAIAAAMNISVNNASVILHRATRALEARLDETNDPRQGARS
jgi:RNA polymerase sigma-70 factor (ECF subfamily)